MIAGTLRIWVAGRPHDLGPGETLTVDAGVRHRFLDPGTEQVVVDVSLPGPQQEDVLVPLAHHLGGRTKMRLADFFVLIVHDVAIGASRAPSRFGHTMMRGLARLGRLFGARPLPRAGAW